jgi:hypothetical protein
MTESDLADFQSALLNILSVHEQSHTIINAIDITPECHGLRSYIDTFEPRMLETGAELVKKWGKHQ